MTTPQNPDAQRLLEDAELLLSRIDTMMSLGFEKHGATMTVPEFFQMVVEHQAWHLANGSKERIRDAIGIEGYSRGNLGIRRSNYLGSRLWGIDHVLAEVEAALHAMAKPGQMGKSALTLVGPPSGGKTTLVGLIFEAAEQLTKPTDGDHGVGPGAFYGIAGCPAHDNPLHFLPNALKEQLRQEHGIVIEGGLCEVCRHQLREYGRAKAREGEAFNFFDYCNENEIRVERLTLSRRSGIGYGYIFPFRPQDMTMGPFLGEPAIRELGRYDADDPRVWNWKVAQPILASSGLLHFEEAFRAAEPQTRVLLTLLEEGFIQSGPFRTYLDELIIMTTNEPNFLEGVRDVHQQALLDRMFCLYAPYSVETAANAKIVVSMMEEDETNEALPHREPGALEILNIIVGLSRLAPRPNAQNDPERDISDRLTRLRIIDNASANDATEEQRTAAREVLVPLERIRGLSDLADLAQGHGIDGMSGVSNRFVAKFLEHDREKLLLQGGNGDHHPLCQSARRLLTGLAVSLASSPLLERMLGRKANELLPLMTGIAVSIWEERARASIDDALWGNALEQKFQEVLKRYLQTVAALETDDDEEEEKLSREAKKLVEDIETRAGIGESDAAELRKQFLSRWQLYDSDSIEAFPELEESVRMELREESARAIVTVLEEGDEASEEDQRIYNETLEGLIAQGCCAVCARERLTVLRP